MRLLALVLARIEAATAALDKVDEATAGRELAAYTADAAPGFQRLREDLRGWISVAARFADALGLTPTSRAKLGLDLTRAKGEALRAHLAEQYIDDGDKGDAA